MAFNFNGKTALVTGASSGLGKLISVELAKLGTHVIGVARREDKLKALQVEIFTKKRDFPGAEFDYVVADLSKKEERRKLIKTIYDKYNGADILVNNAGILIADSAEEYTKKDPEDFEGKLNETLELNLRAPLDLYDRWLFEHRTREDTRVPSLCVWIASISSLYSWGGGIGARAYQIAKSGLVAGVCQERVNFLENKGKPNFNFDLRNLIIYPDTFQTELKIPPGWEIMDSKYVIENIVKAMEGKDKFNEHDDIIIKMNPDNNKRGIYVGFIPTDERTKRPNFGSTLWEKIAEADKIFVTS